MWILMLLLAFQRDPIELETYATQAKCESERDRIMVEMVKSYPDDTDYRLVCRFKPTTM